MNHSPRFKPARGRLALCAIFALLPALSVCPSAHAQSTAMQRVQHFLGEVERGLSYVGKKAEEIIGPGLGIGEERPAAFTASRAFDQRFPVGPTPTVSISNEFGAITVNTWEERLVMVAATITVGAQTLEVAEALAGKTQVSVSNDQDLVEIGNLLPEMKNDSESGSIAVNYTITVPSNANVISDNFFGDTVIRGVSGLVAVEAQYGSLELAELRGTVKVRMHGEFPLRAYSLLHGGTFELTGAQAEFRNISGGLSVYSFRGSVVLSEIAREASVEVDCDSGPVKLILQPGIEPELTATVLYGSLQAPPNLLQTHQQANKTVARLPNPDSHQQIEIAAAFGDLIVEQGAEAGAPAQGVQQGDELFTEVLTLHEPTDAASFLTIDAIPGDIRVEPVDGEAIQVTATRSVWMATAERAPEALRALAVQSQRAGGLVTVGTLASQDLSLLGVSAYNVRLDVKCPRHVPLTIRAQKGDTQVAGMAAAVNIAQAAGEIRIEKCEGELDLNNQQGNVLVTDSVGPVEAVTRYGNLSVTRILGSISTDTSQGSTTIEAPHDDVTVRSTGGNVRILPLDGIQGDYDVQVNNGNLRILLGDQPNAELLVRTRKGTIDSVNLMLGNGTLQGESREYSARILDATHKIKLEAVNGDILID